MNAVNLSFPMILFTLWTTQSQSEFTNSQLYNIFNMNSFPHHDFVVVTSTHWSSVAAENDLRHSTTFDNQFSRLFVESHDSTTISNSDNTATSNSSNWENVGYLLQFQKDDNQSLVVVLFPEVTSALPNMVNSIAKISNPSNMYFIVVPEGEAHQENLSDEILTTAAQFSDWGQDIYVVKPLKFNSTDDSFDSSENYQVTELYSLQKDKAIHKIVDFSEGKIDLDGLLSKSQRRSNMEGSEIKAGAIVKSTDGQYHRWAQVFIAKRSKSSRISCACVDIRLLWDGPWMDLAKYLSLENAYRAHCTNPGENGSFQFNGGVDAEFWMYLTDSYNLSTKAVNVSHYASKLNTNDDDVGSKLRNDEIDIVITAHELNEYRVKQFSFLQSNYFMTLFGFFVQPPASTIRDIFLQAFKTDLWLAMFSTWILIVLGISSLAWVKKRMSDLQENEETILSEALLWATGAICQQGWHVYPESTSMKIIFISGLFTGLVSYVAYSAALVSILSLEVVPIRNLVDVKSSKFMFYGDTLTLNTEYILNEVKDERPELVGTQPIIDIASGIEKVLKKNAVFLGTADGVYPEIQKKNISIVKTCDLVAKIPVNRRPIRVAMLVKKGSPLKEYFNSKILWMFNNGMRYRLIDNYLRNTTLTCLAKSENQKQPLGLNDVFTAFVILLVGYAVSIVVFIIEKLFPRKMVESSALMMQSNFFKDIVVKDYYAY